MGSHGIAATEQSDARQELHELGEYTFENKVGLQWESTCPSSLMVTTIRTTVRLDCIVFPTCAQVQDGVCHILRKADSGPYLRGSSLRYRAEKQRKAPPTGAIFCA